MLENFIQNKFGYCFYCVEPNSAIIYNLYLHPEFRQQGNSRKLLGYVIKEIQDLGHVGDIQIESKPRENSIPVDVLEKYYRSLGLKILLT